MTYKKRTEEEKLKRRLDDRLNPERVWKHNLKSKYKITVEKYNEMFVEQDGACKICKKHPNEKNVSGAKRRLSVDHCHDTGIIRSLLCSRCNISLGGFTHDIEILKSAIEYLEYWQNKDKQSKGYYKNYSDRIFAIY